MGHAGIDRSNLASPLPATTKRLGGEAKLDALAFAAQRRSVLM